MRLAAAFLCFCLTLGTASAALTEGVVFIKNAGKSSEIFFNEKPVNIKRNATLPAAGLRVKVAKDGAFSAVFSNGVAIFASDGADFSVETLKHLSDKNLRENFDMKISVASGKLYFSIPPDPLNGKISLELPDCSVSANCPRLAVFADSDGAKIAPFAGIARVKRGDGVWNVVASENYAKIPADKSKKIDFGRIYRVEVEQIGELFKYADTAANQTVFSRNASGGLSGQFAVSKSFLTMPTKHK